MKPHYLPIGNGSGKFLIPFFTLSLALWCSPLFFPGNALAVEVTDESPAAPNGGDVTPPYRLATTYYLGLNHTPFSQVTYGRLPLGKGGANPLRDSSAAAVGNGVVITADDGGKKGVSGYVRILAHPMADTGRLMSLGRVLNDTEGATWDHGQLVLVTSQSRPGVANVNQLCRFSEHPGGKRWVERGCVLLRKLLMTALRGHFGDRWFQQIQGNPAKKGGLNVEAVASAPSSESGQPVLVLGLRSPLFGDHFGNAATQPGFSLREGRAIVAVVHSPFSKRRTFTFQTLDLKGQGIRGMEWIPALGGYVIISGPVDKRADGFGLWLWGGAEKPPQKLPLPGFQRLCRPESVFQWMAGKSSYLVVLSESSGAACQAAPFSLIRATIMPSR